MWEREERACERLRGLRKTKTDIERERERHREIEREREDKVYEIKYTSAGAREGECACEIVRGSEKEKERGRGSVKEKERGRENRLRMS